VTDPWVLDNVVLAACSAKHRSDLASVVGGYDVIVLADQVEQRRGGPEAQGRLWLAEWNVGRGRPAAIQDGGSLDRKLRGGQIRDVAAEAEAERRDLCGARIAEVGQDSAEIAQHVPTSSGTKWLRHPNLGELEFTHVVLHLADDPEQKLVTFSASRDGQRRLERLLERSGGPAPNHA
jgi:hypothetical protein